MIQAGQAGFQMRGAGVAAILAALIAPATAQNITMDGVARSASLMRLLVESCPDIDRDVGNRYVNAFREAGEKSYGKQAFDRTLARELPRRAQEVREAGASAWCAAQRARMLGMGGAALFRK